MIHKQQAEALAAVLAFIRPGDWRPPQTLAVLAENRETPHPFPVIAEVAVRAARNPAIKSPSGIFLPGGHWDVEDRRAPEPKGDPCGDHPEEQAHNCRCCLADVKSGHRTLAEVGKRRHDHHRTEPPPGWRNHTEAVPSGAVSSVERAEQ